MNEMSQSIKRNLLHKLMKEMEHLEAKSPDSERPIEEMKEEMPPVKEEVEEKIVGEDHSWNGDKAFISRSKMMKDRGIE